MRTLRWPGHKFRLLLAGLAMLLLTGCQDDKRIQELEGELSALQKRTEREKQLFDERDKKREETLKAKLEGLGDVEEVHRQLKLSITEVYGTVTKMAQHVEAVEAQVARDREVAKGYRGKVLVVMQNREVAMRQKQSILSLKDGSSLIEAQIVGFMEKEVLIRHSAGEKRVAYDQLPGEMAEKFLLPEIEFAPLPEAPAINLQGALNLGSFYPELDLANIKDDKLLNLLGPSNRTLVEIETLQELMAAEGIRMEGVVQGSRKLETNLDAIESAIGARITKASELKGKVPELTYLLESVAREIKLLESNIEAVKEEMKIIPGMVRSESASRSIPWSNGEIAARTQRMTGEMKRSKLDPLMANLLEKQRLSEQTRGQLTNVQLAIQKMESEMARGHDMRNAEKDRLALEMKQGNQEMQSSIFRKNAMQMKLDDRKALLTKLVREQKARLTWIDRRMLELARAAKS